MPCDSSPTITPAKRQRQQDALTRLRNALASGAATVVLSPQGAVAFRGWTDNEGLSDVCAYRRLTAANSPELRRALMRAEAMTGRKVNPQAINAGLHSHDGGATWSSH